MFTYKNEVSQFVRLKSATKKESTGWQEQWKYKTI